MKRIVFAIALVCSTLILGACAPTTMVDLSHSGVSRKFTVADSYEVVYRRILDHARTCYAGTRFLARTEVQNTLYPDAREADVKILFYNMVGSPQIFLDAHIIGQPNRAADVSELVADVGRWKHVDSAVYLWATGGDAGCFPEADLTARS